MEKKVHMNDAASDNQTFVRIDKKKKRKSCVIRVSVTTLTTVFQLTFDLYKARKHIKYKTQKRLKVFEITYKFPVTSE